MIKLEMNLSPTQIEEYASYFEEKIDANYKRNTPTNSVARSFFENEAGKYSDVVVKKLLKERITPDLLKQFTPRNKNNPQQNNDQDIIDQIKRVIDYKMLGESKKHQLLLDMKVTVCPYCNRQFITNYTRKDKHGKIVGEHSTAAIDHFYPQSKYPQLALSLYNFIPCCDVCNSRMKLDDVSGIVYPYDNSFVNECRFILKGSGKADDKYAQLLNTFRGINDDKVKLELKNECKESDLKNKIKQSIRVFHLNEVYKVHSKYAVELVFKQMFFGDEYRTNQNKILKTIGSGTSFDELSKEELERVLYGFNWKNGVDTERPLSKLAYDILYRQ